MRIREFTFGKSLSRACVAGVMVSAVLAMLAACSISAADLIEVHVAPTGNDAADGSRAKPVGSLIGARDAVRRLRAAGKTGPVRVVVADGTYRVVEPLVLTPEDGGSAEAPVRYEAAPGAKPVFSGGRVIAGFKPAGDGVWAAQVPEVAAGKWYFEQLFVDGKRAVRAREPNRFWHYLEKVEEEVLNAERGVDGRRARGARQTVKLRTDDAAILRGLKPEDLKDVNLVVYHNWDNTRRFIDSFDAATSTLVTTGAGMKPWNQWKRNSHYIIENCKAACDAPGEWFLGRDGVLIYRPLPGQDMAKSQVVAPVSERFILIQGTAAKPVAHVTFSGLAFRHGQWLTPESGFEPHQAAAPIEAAVQADGASHVTFERCEIGHLGIYALWFRKGCSDNTVRQCHIHDFGAGGVRIGEANWVMDAKEPTQRNTIDNNIIRNGGWIFPCAVGVWIGSSPDNTVTHNDISDLFYSGISAGWCWGYDASTCKRNTIRFNHVHHLGKGLLSDMGGIYTLGPSEGTVVANNVFHDISSYSYGGWGMYTDEGSTGITFEDNLVYNTKDGSFHQHYGKENIVRNNILVDSKERQIALSRTETHLTISFERNIIVWKTGPALSGSWGKSKTVSGGNCWFNSAGAPIEFMGKPLAEWQKAGHETGSIIADPLLTDPDNGDFRVKPGSPALALGFKPFDYAKAGVYGDAEWIALAKAWTYAPVGTPPIPRPVAVDDTFERDEPGKPPRGVEMSVEKKDGAAIVVTNETAGEGKQSVKLVDAAGLKKAWEPQMGWTVDYASGAATCAFWLRVEKASVLNLEWRDRKSAPGGTGARLRIQDGKLRLDGGQTLDLPMDQWVRYVITGTLGVEDGKWSLAVTLPGQETKTFADLPYQHQGFRQLTWFGVMSTANATTTSYLDGVSLSVK
jgi:hypothetical protein